MFDRFGRAREQYTAQYHIIAPTVFLGGLFLVLGGALLLSVYGSRTLDITPIAHAQTTVSGTQQCPLKNDLYLNPFNKDSAFHRPIGTGAVYAGDNHPVTQVWKQLKGGFINDPSPYGSPFAVAESSHASVTLTYKSCPEWKHNPTGSNFPITLRIPPNFPPNFKNKECIDNSGAILDRATGIIREFYELNPTNRTASVVRTYDARGLGHGATRGERVGTSASGISTVAGAVRAQELNTKGMKITHAFHLAVPTTLEQSKATGMPEMLNRNFQWPAVSTDTHARIASANNGVIPYGSLMAIPPVSKGGPDLSTLGLSEPGLRFAEAMRDYGVYIVDAGGSVAFRASEPLGSVGTLVRADVKKLLPQLRLVTNSVTGATARTLIGDTLQTEGSIGTPSWPAGGGTPLAPNCAYNAPDNSQAISTPIAPVDGGSSGGTTGGGTSGGGTTGGGGGLSSYACHQYGPNARVVPPGYGAAFSFYSNTILITGMCRSSIPQGVEVTVGDGAQTTYVFNISYFWNGSEWVPITLTSTGASTGAWILGQGTGFIPVFTPILYHVAYVCQFVGGSYRCGCSDEQCRQSKWQVQMYANALAMDGASAAYSGGVSGGGTTGGGTTGGGTTGGGTTGGGTQTGGSSGAASALCPVGTGASQTVTPSTLAGALANAGPGSTILLESGTYNGTITVSANGSANNPIHIKAAPGATATMKGRMQLEGNYIRVEGLTFNEGVVVITGNYNRVTGSTFRNFGQPAVMIAGGGSNNRIDHNDIGNLKQGGSGYGVQIKLTGADKKIAQNNTIDHNYIHDFSGFDDNGHEGIQIGQGPVSTTWDTGTRVINNLLEKVEVDDEAISVKSSGSYLEGNTLLNSKAFFSSRHGRNHVWKNNYLDNALGFTILGVGHVVEGNTVVNGGYVRLMAGDVTQDQFEKTRENSVYARAENVMVRNNTAPIIVGYDNWADTLPALNTTLVGNKGSISLNKHSGTNNQGQGAGSNAVALSRSDVGPSASDPYCN